MYVVLIALLYVLMMMVVTAESIFKGIMILLIGGALIALVFYLLDTPRRIRLRRMVADEANESDPRTDE
jgi:hypothetical protein